MIRWKREAAHLISIGIIVTSIALVVRFNWLPRQPSLPEVSQDKVVEIGMKYPNPLSIEKLSIGMNRSEVEVVLGQPIDGKEHVLFDHGELWFSKGFVKKVCGAHLYQLKRQVLETGDSVQKPLSDSGTNFSVWNLPYDVKTDYFYSVKTRLDWEI